MNNDDDNINAKIRGLELLIPAEELSSEMVEELQAKYKYVDLFTENKSGKKYLRVSNDPPGYEYED